MSVVKLDTGFNIELVLPITPFHKRLYAWAVDLAVQFAWLYFIAKLFNALIDPNWEKAYPWLAVLCFLPVFLYHLFFEIALNGQSPGKKAVRIKVITTEGGQPTVSQYMLRWAFKSIDLPFWMLAGILYGNWPFWMVIFLFSGLACLVSTKTSQRIGDLLAGTVLVDIHNKSTWQDTVFMETEEDYQPVFPQVMQLSDRDINSIKQVLATSTARYNNTEYVNRIALKVQQALKIETTMDGPEFLESLLKDYNHLSVNT